MAQEPCPHCGPIQTNHYQQWIADLFYVLTPFRYISIPSKVRYALASSIDRFFLRVGAVKTTKDLNHPGFPLRTKVFLREALPLGMTFRAITTPYGLNNQFILDNGGRSYAFEGLPRAEFMQSTRAERIDDKLFVKRILEKNGLPVARGRAFSVLQKKRVETYVEQDLGYPVIVKPVTGSMSQHITTNIQNRTQLQEAILKVAQYTPYFMVERYINSPYVYRANVIDQDFVAVVRRIPAHVVGDGVHTIQELIDHKNADPRRGPAGDQSFVLYHLTFDDVSEKLLQQKGYTVETVPQEGEPVYLQEKVILDIGADLEEVTPQVHPDNIELFRRVATIFGIYLVGIDLLAKDIAISWKEQECAILELNSLPYIDMHHYPSIGEPVNIGAQVAKMVAKYYT
ncbi:MAG: hypothetical protein WC045_02760 [Patescibacteria group bacterium]